MEMETEMEMEMETGKMRLVERLPELDGMLLKLYICNIDLSDYFFGC
jgi:hypothetical protein